MASKKKYVKMWHGESSEKGFRKRFVASSRKLAPSCDHPEEILKIPTKLPIVYVKKGNFFVLPYLDLRQKGKVWGISSGGVFWKKESGVKDYNSAMDIVKNLSDECFCSFVIPETFQLKEAIQEVSLFADTVGVLRKYGIKADGWKSGNYLTSDECNAWQVFVCNMENAKETVECMSTPCNYRIAVLWD